MIGRGSVESPPNRRSKQPAARLFSGAHHLRRRCRFEVRLVRLEEHLWQPLKRGDQTRIRTSAQHVAR